MKQTTNEKDDKPTLRDLFAMAALVGLFARGTTNATAELAYWYADQMLKERGQNAEGS